METLILTTHSGAHLDALCPFGPGRQNGEPWRLVPKPVSACKNVRPRSSDQGFISQQGPEVHQVTVEPSAVVICAQRQGDHFRKVEDRRLFFKRAPDFRNYASFSAYPLVPAFRYRYRPQTEPLARTLRSDSIFRYRNIYKRLAVDILRAKMLKSDLLFF